MLALISQKFCRKLPKHLFLEFGTAQDISVWHIFLGELSKLLEIGKALQFGKCTKNVQIVYDFLWEKILNTLN